MPVRRSTAILTCVMVLFVFRVAACQGVWQKVDVGVGFAQINGVAMTSNGQHIVLANSADLHSSDGGITWEKLGSTPERITFGDSTHLFEVGSGQGCNLPNGYAEMGRSTDFGKTWQVIPIQVPMCFLGLSFVDSIHGWAVGAYKDSIVITSDGGRTVRYQPYGVPSYGGGGVIFLDTLRGWVAGRMEGTDTAILSTTDGGNTWSHHSLGVAYADAGPIAFVDSLHGWVIGGYYQSRIFHTSDGGITWAEQGNFGSFQGSIKRVRAVDSLHAWVFGDYFSPYIWKTVDGGQTWILDYNGPGSYVTDAVMVDLHHGAVVGSDGTVLIYRYSPTLGDLNGDGEVTACDVVLELDKVFLDQPYPEPEQEGDVNCDGTFSPADVVLVLLRAFADKPFPCSV